MVNTTVIGLPPFCATIAPAILWPAGKLVRICSAVRLTEGDGRGPDVEGGGSIIHGDISVGGYRGSKSVRRLELVIHVITHLSAGDGICVVRRARDVGVC